MSPSMDAAATARSVSYLFRARGAATHAITNSSTLAEGVRDHAY